MRSGVYQSSTKPVPFRSCVWSAEGDKAGLGRVQMWNMSMATCHVCNRTTSGDGRMELIQALTGQINSCTCVVFLFSNRRYSKGAKEGWCFQFKNTFPSLPVPADKPAVELMIQQVPTSFLLAQDACCEEITPRTCFSPWLWRCCLNISDRKAALQ